MPQPITLLYIFGISAVSKEAIIATTVVLSAAAFLLLNHFLGRRDLRERFIQRGLYGIDLLKTTEEERKKIKEQMHAGGLAAVDPKLRRGVVPESMGVLCGLTYIFVLVVLQMVAELPPDGYSVVLSASLSILLILLLGFMDDVLDLRWRHKLIYSFLSTIPLLVLYHGSTTVVVPIPLRPYLGTALDLGVLYLAYMSMLCTFSSNSINILAGLNGLEVGQSLIIAASILAHNLIELRRNHAAAHLLSFVFILPFFAVSLALYRHNRYPAQVFVGDAFTCFAGQVLASASIVGHFSKTYCLFLLPQILNFLLSVPQLLRIIPCPRHRMPKRNERTGKLEWTPNGTLLNLFLRLFGSRTEARLCRDLLVFQAACSVAGFAIRYYGAGLVFDYVD